MRKSLYVLAAVMLLVSCAGGKNWKKTGHGIVASGERSQVEVICYAPDIVRVVKYPLYAHPDMQESASVVLRPEKVRFHVQETSEGQLELQTDALIVQVDLSSSTVRFFRKDGTAITRELDDSMTLHGARDDFRVCQSFALDPDEAIYGLGQHQDSGLDQHGRAWHLENNNTEIGIPLVHSAKGYAIYWDNYSPAGFHSETTSMFFTSESGEKCDYYLICGENADQVIGGIRHLTGEVPLSPRWTYGFLQSRERYRSQDELVGTVRRYRELGVPLDGIIQDWQYWGEPVEGEHRMWNAVAFLNPAFPDPAAMLQEIHDMHAHALISVWPSFGPDTDLYKEFEQKGMLMPHRTFPPLARSYDPWNQQARDIYWHHMEENLWNAGIDGWWLDATEPEVSGVRQEDYDYVSPEGTFRHLRNSYPLYTVGGVYDHQRALTGDRRVAILTRSATAGLQRYGAHVWSGDVESDWNVLRYQIAEGLNLSLCGIPYWNSDIGGFYTWRTFPEGVADPAFRKLYGRWMQFAGFTGMMRSHGTNTPREIWQFGAPGDADFELQRKAITLRYRLLPYTYSTAWEVTTRGGSLMRALFMDYPSDAQAREEDTEFLYGRRLLVAPVVTPDSFRSVYLPEGDWTDFWSGGRVHGGVCFTHDGPEDEIPLYVKAGTILPMGPEVQYADEKPWDDLQIRIYTGADGSFSLYEDEGDGYAYEQGAFSTIGFSWNDADGVLTIGTRKGNWPGMSVERRFRIVLVREGVASGLDIASTDVEVTYTGKQLLVDLK